MRNQVNKNEPATKTGLSDSIQMVNDTSHYDLTHSFYQTHYQPICETLHLEHKYRILPDSNRFSSKKIPAPNCIDFSSNDYLGLSQSQIVLDAAIEAGRRFGVGSTGSRLLSGNIPIFETFEKQIAKDKQTESALIFNSGYQANLSVLSALATEEVLKQKPLILFDKLNHASLYQAIRLSGADLQRYAHLDMNRLEALLAIDRKQHNRPIFVVSETVFGMDGDIVPMTDLIGLCERFGAFLYLDEAHATGLFGPKGYGISTAFDLNRVEHVIMGTFSKAIGSSGAYIACSTGLKNYLINRCSGFIYSTALSPMVIGAAQKAWEIIAHLNRERHQLLMNAQDLRNQLQTLGFNTGHSKTHIIPIILNNEQHVLQSQAHLLQQGFLLSAIRPPTVPPNTARLRIALTLKHQTENWNNLISELQRLAYLFF
jgi:8-amino-7-oxononanoate synthase